MIRETELFFEAVMRDDLSILDFLDSDFTYVNERLARHYGIPGVKGEQFRRVKFKGRERGGLVTQASILTVTSNPTRTSPVKRGKWVLEQLLGTPPPPPPPNVPLLKEDAKALTAATLRLRMEQHRSQASCAVCHSKLDPLGFGLENFDAVGGWRDTDAGVAIDSSGKLPSGESFRGPKELRAILKAHAPDFTRCLTEKMLTYALGRGLEESDRCAVDQIVRSLEADRYRFSALVLGIVKSDPFQKRRPVSERLRIEARGEASDHEATTANIAADGLARRGQRRSPCPGWRRWPQPRSRPTAPARAVVAPKRMAFLYVPNGVHMPDWVPKRRARSSRCRRRSNRSSRHRDNLLVLTGLAQHNAEALGDGPGDHARSLACFLTGAHPLKTDGAGIRVGVSVDQVAAREIGRQTRLPSLELGIERGAQSGNCDSGYSCAYSSNISWRSANMPMAKEINPRLVFDRLFTSQGPRGLAGRARQARALREEHPRLRLRRRPAASRPRGLERSPQDRRVPDGRP